MTQRGILAIFNNIVSGRAKDFDNWFQGEHLPERIAVPGFLYGRRHQALSGASAYFNFYVVEGPEVLTSKPYLDRLNDPTPRSRVTMTEIFKDMCRTVCRRELRVGGFRGGMTVTARFWQPQDVTALKTALADFAKDETVVGEVWSSAEKPGVVAEEERLRGGDKKFAQCLLIDTLHQAKAEQIAARLKQAFPSAEIGVFRVIAHLGDAHA
jgi:hypothetical protein